MNKILDVIQFLIENDRKDLAQIVLDEYASKTVATVNKKEFVPLSSGRGVTITPTPRTFPQPYYVGDSLIMPTVTC